MEKGDYIEILLRSANTVFSAGEVLLLWGEPDSKAARARINYYVKKGKLYRVRRGLYAKDKNYNQLELATRIFTPSYVSFETVLTQAGMIFQFYGRTTFVASYLKRVIQADGASYSYRKIKNDILTNHVGIESKEGYSIATPERAFLDVLYAYKDYHFDNLRPLNWEKVESLLPIYGGNRRMQKLVKRYRESASTK
jgi:predicted transcriptional regulator of viral defense system